MSKIINKNEQEREENRQKNRLFILNNGLSKRYVNDLKKATIKSNFNICE